jgi:hypothetical protein
VKRERKRISEKVQCFSGCQAGASAVAGGSTSILFNLLNEINDPPP